MAVPSLPLQKEDPILVTGAGGFVGRNLVFALRNRGYDNILRFADDPDVRDPIKFLREREIVHYQRFGEGLRIATDRLDSKNFYAFNPSFD